VLVRKVSESADVGNVALGIAQRLKVDRLRLPVDSLLKFRRVVPLDDPSFNTGTFEGVDDLVVRAEAVRKSQYDQERRGEEGKRTLRRGTTSKRCCLPLQPRSRTPTTAPPDQKKSQLPPLLLPTPQPSLQEPCVRRKVSGKKRKKRKGETYPTVGLPILE
jgi:hypothetical protein